VLAALFARSFVPQYVLFSNDGPLGAMASQAQVKWSNFRGMWMDLNSISSQYVSCSPSVTQILNLALNTVAWAKFYAPLALLALGLAAGFCFRRLGLSNLACVLGALAAACFRVWRWALAVRQPALLDVAPVLTGVPPFPA
jgi:hypothetical protein